MLSAEQVIALARAEGLGHVAEELVDWVRPGWRIVPSGAAPLVGTSKVGGSPDLAEGDAWPVSPRGIPLGFIAQIDCSALPPLALEWQDRVCSWQHGGQLVRLFTNILEDFEVGAAQALSCDPNSPLTRVPAPPVPDPWPAGGFWDDLELDERARLYVLPETPVCFEPFLTAPETHPLLRPELDRYDELADRYGGWVFALRVDGAANDESAAVEPSEVHHLLGEAISVQDDIRYVGAMLHQSAHEWASERQVPADPALARVDAWQVLLGLYMDDRLRLEIFDGGALYILAPVADLAEGRLDRLVFGTESG